MALYNYKRRKSSEVKVGDVTIGGLNPVRIQSMTNTSTMDTAGSAEQIEDICGAGGEIVRLTTQGEREAANISEIKKILKERNVKVPLVADVHFNPNAAFKAVETCEKVRINPGNFVDAARTFRKLDFTDEEYAAEIERIRHTFVPFLDKCKEYGTAIRLGVNHGSLSDRIMSRYGDTPEGMVESVMEYLRICREENFKDVVISIKASNVIVMVETVRLLVKRMEQEDMHFPLHLGVTEAGDAEDGRIKSAVGIGTLLSEGIGDTIRVSLTEEPKNEIPVASKLKAYVSRKGSQKKVEEPEERKSVDLTARASMVEGFDGVSYPLVYGVDFTNVPETWHTIDASSKPELFDDNAPVILTSENSNFTGEVASWIDRFVAMGGQNPVIVRKCYEDKDIDDIRIKAGVDFGPLMIDRYLSGIMIEAPAMDSDELNNMSLSLLQAARLRISHTEYIACPGCGRTLFDLQKTLQEVKKATKGLKGLKIGVMGCIVNGPGEMADADYGYVGAGPGKVSLYKGKRLVKKNIESEKAIEELLLLIKENENKGEN